MKFIYEYRTSDNVRHEGVVSAPNRDAAFAALKAQGIRPGSLRDAPGFFNKLFGKGKRWIAIGVLSAVCGVLVVIIRSAPTPPAYASLDASLDSPLRRQIIGDSAVIEKGVRTGWSDVFDLEGDRFLASFAIPGVSASVRSTTEENLLKALSTPHSASCTDAEGIESRQIRAIVAGMKRELRAYLAAGGTLASYGKRLVNRQEAEIGYYNRVKMELETASKSGIDEQRLLPLWEKKNNELRNLGVKLVPLPE